MLKTIKNLIIIPLMLSITAFSAYGAKVRIKIASGYPLGLPILGTSISFVEKTLNEASAGTMKAKIYAPGKLVGPREILDAVAKGKVTAGFAAAGFWAGSLPVAPLFGSVPFGPESPEYLAWFRNGNGMKLYQKMYDQAGYDVKPIICGMLPPETSGWFAKPINTVEDLKGLKMRFYGLGGDVMQKLGVSTSLLPGGEIFAALEKGVLDATEFSMPAIDEKLGFHRVVKYNYFPGWHQQGSTLELLINKTFYEEKLDSGQRTLLETACLAATANAIAEGEALQFESMKKNVNEQGVILKRWSPEMLATFKATWEEVAAEKMAEDPFFKEVYADLNQFRKNYDLWESNAFLPRPTPAGLN